MDNYLSNNNKIFILNASIQMLKDRFDITLSTNELNKLLSNITSNIYTIYNNKNINVHELNKITLTNVKDYIENLVNKQLQQKESHNNELPIQNDNNIEKIDNIVMDNDHINKKLKELEINRRIIPSINNELLKDDNISNILQNNTNPISINIPQKILIEKSYKNFIINSNNRDWFLNPNRNNIKFNIPINIKNNDIYIECICFPKNIKNITPYVLMNISDGIKNINYILICDIHNDKWDIWKPCSKDIENISLNNQTWIITFYDFNNKLLDIGDDNINIIDAELLDKTYIILNIGSFINQFNENDYIIIRDCNGKIYNKKIIGINIDGNISKNNFIIVNQDDDDNCDIKCFIDGKILNMSLQYSCIIKYCSM